MTSRKQDLFSLIQAGRLPRIQAAALTYVPALHEEQERLFQRWSRGVPVLTHIIRTPLGHIGLFVVPLTSTQLYQRQDDLLVLSARAVQMAGQVGAQTVALTGLLSSALGYGRDLVQAMAGQADLPAITTGHATTTAAMVMNIRRLLLEAGRDLASESVVCVGLGSIGWTTLQLMLQVLPHPRRLLLCDLPARREALEGMCRQVRTLGFQGESRTVVVPQGAVPGEVYEASLLVGATNVANVVDVERLQSGCLLVDDSAPHCFRSDLVWERMQRRGDLLVTEGGELRVPDAWPEAMSEVRYVPRYATIDALMLSEEMIALRSDPRQIMGCLLAGMIASAMQLPTTLGLVEAPVAMEHYHALWNTGFRAAAPHLENSVLTPAYVQQFRQRFGAV